LGHPTYALSVVLFSLILWTGVGSMISERVRLAGAGKLVAWSVASACYLFALPFWLPPLLADLDGAGLFVRARLCALGRPLAGFLSVSVFPTAIRLISPPSPGPTPGLWVTHGVAWSPAPRFPFVPSIACCFDTPLRSGAALFFLPTVPAVLLARDP